MTCWVEPGSVDCGAGEFVAEVLESVDIDSGMLVVSCAPLFVVSLARVFEICTKCASSVSMPGLANGCILASCLISLGARCVGSGL